MNRKILTVTLNPALDRTYVVNDFKPGELNKIQSTRTDAGGKGINVARALGHFGMDVLATGLNGGSSGKFLESVLEKENIPFDFYEIPGETRTNMKISDQTSGVTTELNEKGFHVCEGDIGGFLRKLDSLARTAGYLVLSGSLPQGVSPGIYADLVRTYKSRGLKVILDADNESLKLGAEAAPFALKPNLKELSCVAGKVPDTDAEIAAEARKLIDSGIERVAVTMGARGMMLFSKDGAYAARPFATRIACTTGAGDASLAALVYSIIEGLSLSETAAYMTCAGTLSSAMEGTAACGLDDIRNNISRISLERIW